MAEALTRERRATPRVSSLAGRGWEYARLRPGRTARVLDLSAGGALIETDWRLLPGMRVEIQLGNSAAVIRASGRILRCHVALVDRERVHYRGGGCLR